MAQDSVVIDPAKTSDVPGAKAQWWCNFCNFESNDMQEYLSHSCQDVLAERGVKVVPTGQSECR